MGKTFFLKKLGFADSINILEFKQATAVGRVLSMDCSHFEDQIQYLGVIQSCFWQALIVYHLCYIFDNSLVAKINFQKKSLPFILTFFSSQTNCSNALEVWMKRILATPTEGAFLELNRLTNAAFGVRDDSIPVLLLDNAHSFAKRILPQKMNTFEMEVENKRPKTLLSVVLNELTKIKPYCIVAGNSFNHFQSFSIIFNHF